MGGRWVDGQDFKDQGQTPNMELSIFDYGETLLVFETRGLVGKMVLGRWALKPLRRTPAPPLAALVVGVALLFFIGLIPILGDLFWFVVTVTGMGAALLQVRESRAAQAPTSPPEGDRNR